MCLNSFLMSHIHCPIVLFSNFLMSNVLEGVILYFIYSSLKWHYLHVNKCVQRIIVRTSTLYRSLPTLKHQGRVKYIISLLAEIYSNFSSLAQRNFYIFNSIVSAQEPNLPSALAFQHSQ